MTVAASVFRALCSAGAATVFGLPGTHNMAFWAAPRGGSIPRLVNVRHEQTAVYAADGWARASGRLGAALVTTGPGAANTLAAFGEAAMSGSPVVLIASEVPVGVAETGVEKDAPPIERPGWNVPVAGEGQFYAPFGAQLSGPTSRPPSRPRWRRLKARSMWTSPPISLEPRPPGTRRRNWLPAWWMGRRWKKPPNS